MRRQSLSIAFACLAVVFVGCGKQKNGEACDKNSECESGYCVCASACRSGCCIDRPTDETDYACTADCQDLSC